MVAHDFPDIADVNERFYAATPDRYFSLRLGLLLTLAATTQRYGADLAEGLACGPLRLQQTSPGPVQFAPQEVERYLAIETVMLHHHLAESIVRLYLAHLNHHQCPWIEIALLRDFRTYRKLEKGIAEEDEIADAQQVATVFLGSKEPPTGSGVSPDRWLAAANCHRTLLIEFARHSYEGANLYNAAKHGLALSGESGTVAIGPADDVPAFVVDGPWVEYLERAAAPPPEPRTWFRTAELVNAPRSWLHILAGTHMLVGLWAAGYVKHCRGSELRPFVAAAELDPGALMVFGVQSGINSMSFPLGAERRGDD